ncbi:MAG: hypothetical protein K2L07_01145 [Lachnospiraceae bacterium]|nr:hypothetical protein [Lachnospiraceae bacterium]
MPMKKEKREPSKMECFARKMEMYNSAERSMVNFIAGGAVVCGGIMHLIFCVMLWNLGVTGIAFSMITILLLFLLFSVYLGLGSRGTDVYLKIGNPQGKKLQAISWAVCYEPMEWKIYYKVIWKKLLFWGMLSAAAWLVLSLSAIPISWLVSGEWSQPAYAGHIFVMCFLGAGMMLAGLYAGFSLAKGFEEQRRRHIRERDTKWIQMKKEGERKSASRQWMTVRIIYVEVVFVLSSVIGDLSTRLSVLPEGEIAYRRWSSIGVVITMSILVACTDKVVEVVDQIQQRKRVEWHKLAVPFLGILLILWGVSGSTTFYEEHVVVKTVFGERSYDYRDAEQYYISNDSGGMIQMTIQFANREIEVFGNGGFYRYRYSDAFYESADTVPEYDYTAYLAGQLHAAGVRGKVLDKAALEENVMEWEDEDILAVWKQILEIEHDSLSR